MITAAYDCCIALFVFQQFCAAMGATVVQYPDGILVANYNNRIAGDFAGQVITWMRYLALMAQVVPGTGKDTFYFQAENFRVKIHIFMYAIRSHQGADIFRIIFILHGFLVYPCLETALQSFSLNALHCLLKIRA